MGLLSIIGKKKRGGRVGRTPRFRYESSGGRKSVFLKLERLSIRYLSCAQILGIGFDNQGLLELLAIHIHH
jgi:hypothetical protein